jgi:hypothetical protein
VLDEVATCVAALAPAIILNDVLVSQVSKSEFDKRIGSFEEKLLIDVASKCVPVNISTAQDGQLYLTKYSIPFAAQYSVHYS